jgi:hypothetical protein
MEDVLDGVCSMHRTNEKCIIFWSENPKVKQDHLGDLVIHGRKYSVSLRKYCATVWSDSTSKDRVIFFQLKSWFNVDYTKRNWFYVKFPGYRCYFCTQNYNLIIMPQKALTRLQYKAKICQNWSNIPVLHRMKLI